MQLILKKKTGFEVDITQGATSVTLTGDYQSCCRSLDFGFVSNAAAAKEEIWNGAVPPEILVGDGIRVLHEGTQVFSGIVWTKTKNTDSNEIDFSCRDYGIYLKKNKGSYVITNMKPSDIVRKICTDYGLPMGDIVDTNNFITRNFMGVTLYDIIMTAYSLAGTDGKKYMCIVDGEKVCVREKGAEQVEDLVNGFNLISANVSQSLERMINTVRVYGKNDTLLKEAAQSDDVEKYGKMIEIVRINDDTEDYGKKIDRTFQKMEQKITVSNFGNLTYQTGKKVQLKEPYTGLIGVFHIESDTHTFKNGLYTNKLTLNLDNIMDEKESGSEVKEK